MIQNEINKQLISLCKFYKGGQTCQNTDPNTQMCWRCEQYWVEQSNNAYSGGDTPLSGMIDEYLRAGLRQFEQYDNVPITLKAILFNRYCKYNERMDIPGFKKFYLEQYHK